MNTNGVVANGLSTSADYEEISIPVPWGEIRGKWWGSRESQPIIALHGWQDNAGTFDNLAPLLVARGLSVLCIDMPGHGFSSHFAPGHYYYLFWDGLHLLRRIVKHYNWNKISIIGHSLGGCIAFLYAAVYPNEVKSYVSFDISSPLVRRTDKMIDAMGASIDKFLKYESLTPENQPCYDYEQMIDIVEQAHNGSLTRYSCEVMMRRGMSPTGADEQKYQFNRDPRLKVMSLGFMTREHVIEFAHRITCDVLNVKATIGIKFEDYDFMLDEIAKSASSVERHLVEGTHHVHLNEAEKVAGIVADFLLKQ